MTAWPELDRAALLEDPRAEREARILAFMAAVVLALRKPPGEPPGGTERLTELGLDSLQFVELKFALDTLAGTELDIEPFVSDPTLSEVAALVAAALRSPRTLDDG